MKYPRILLLAVALVAGVSISLAQTYWPVDSSKNPIQRGTHVGYGYVAGTNDAACADSIAIGGNALANKAIVVDATNACQIGTGTNSDDGTLQYRSRKVPLVYVDSTTNTITTAFSAACGGCILTGQITGTNKVWISSGSGTNSWTLLN